MELKNAVILLVLVSSMILTFFSSNYAMALVFCSASGLFAFLQWNEDKKDSDLENIKNELRQQKERLDQLSFGRLTNK